MRIGISIDIKDHPSPASVKASIDYMKKVVTKETRRGRTCGDLYKAVSHLQKYYAFLTETYVEELNTPFPQPSRRQAPIPPNGFEEVVS